MRDGGQGHPCSPNAPATTIRERVGQLFHPQHPRPYNISPQIQSHDFRDAALGYARINARRRVLSDSLPNGCCQGGARDARCCNGRRTHSRRSGGAQGKARRALRRRRLRRRVSFERAGTYVARGRLATRTNVRPTYRYTNFMTLADTDTARSPRNPPSPTQTSCVHSTNAYSLSVPSSNGSIIPQHPATTLHTANSPSPYPTTHIYDTSLFQQPISCGNNA